MPAKAEKRSKQKSKQVALPEARVRNTLTDGVLADKIYKILIVYGRKQSYNSLVYFLLKDKDIIKWHPHSSEQFDDTLDRVLAKDKRWSLTLAPGRITPVVMLED